MLRRKHRLRALTFEYAGIAGSELRAARAMAIEAKVEEHRVVRLPDLKEAQDIPGSRFPDLPPSYIPMRNGIFYFFAASYAEEARAAAVAGGHNKDDLQVFRDVSPAFFSKLQDAFWSGSRILAAERTRILRPLGGYSKPQVVRKAARLGVPLGLTWSCHRDGAEHCWKCEGCEARETAFRGAGVADPLMPR